MHEYSTKPSFLFNLLVYSTVTKQRILKVVSGNNTHQQHYYHFWNTFLTRKERQLVIMWQMHKL